MVIWRLLITEPAAGAWNMAVDEAVATLAARGESPPTLRFYRWQPGAVSLGRHQPHQDVDPERLQAHGYDLVRRPTGGRAILHIDELTYSVAGPQQEPRLAGAVLDAYHRISQGLALGLRRLGVDAVEAALPGPRSGSQPGPVCFETPSAYELCVAGRKIIGSAQSRRAGYVLQHGSLPLEGDITRLVDVLALPQEARAQQQAQLAARASTLAALMGRRVTFWEAAAALIDGLTTALEIDLQEGELSPAELALAQTLHTAQYTSTAWLHRVS
ncbi:MAG: lipoate--protein ligase family protein [Caldilineales bacterium]|nr:lipoate--protein ligase family protein [Caldilineales bacterium]